MGNTKVCRTCGIEKQAAVFNIKNHSCKQCVSTKHRAKLKEKRPERYMWTVCKKGCQKSGVRFEIEISDIIIPEFCPYLGIRLVFSDTGKAQPDSPSIDKIDPTKGYVKGNIEVISVMANRAKNNLSPLQLITFANAILARAK